MVFKVRSQAVHLIVPCGTYCKQDSFFMKWYFGFRYQLNCILYVHVKIHIQFLTPYIIQALVSVHDHMDL